jgi:hypothetical protein
LAAYLLHAQKLKKNFEVLDLQHIPCANNTVTDELSTKASMWAPGPKGVFEQWLQQPTTRPAELGEGGKTSTSKLVVPVNLFIWSPPRIVGVMGNSMNLGAQDTDAQVSPNAWIMEIQDYLKDNILPDEHVSAEQIIRVAKRYTLVQGDLYRRGTNDVLMQCITQEGNCELLIEIHGGECGNHASSCTLVGKAFRHGFYKPTALQDAIELVKRCEAFQFHVNMNICHMGDGHPGPVPQGRWRIPVSVHRHRQVHQLTGSNPCGQDQ